MHCVQCARLSGPDSPSRVGTCHCAHKHPHQKIRGEPYPNCVRVGPTRSESVRVGPSPNFQVAAQRAVPTTRLCREGTGFMKRLWRGLVREPFDDWRRRRRRKRRRAPGLAHRFHCRAICRRRDAQGRADDGVGENHGGQGAVGGADSEAVRCSVLRADMGERRLFALETLERRLRRRGQHAAERHHPGFEHVD